MDDQSIRIAAVAIFFGIVRMVNWIWLFEKAGYAYGLLCQKAKKAWRKAFKLIG